MTPVYNSVLMKEESESTSISSKIPYSLQALIEKAVKGSHYLNASNFVREAITEKLQRDGYFSKKVNESGG